MAKFQYVADRGSFTVEDKIYNIKNYIVDIPDEDLQAVSFCRTNRFFREIPGESKKEPEKKKSFFTGEKKDEDSDE